MLRRREQKTRLKQVLRLQCGEPLTPVDIAFETYGTLAEDRSNVVIVLHGLTANQHAAGEAVDGGRPGWWCAAIGPGRAIDTDRWYVVCPNVLGGTTSTGPGACHPTTGRAYGRRFPVIAVGDMVAAQIALLDQLGIANVAALIGGCLGGFQVLEWLVQAPERVGRAVIISATAKTSAHNTALWHVLRSIIASDPKFNDGDYYDGPGPELGVGLMAMAGALFWLSPQTLEQKFGTANLHELPRYTMETDFAVEHFLESVRNNASNRLDPNSFMTLTRAIDYFDLARDHGSIKAALSRVRAPVLLVSYEKDWRYPPAEMAKIAAALRPQAQVEELVLESAMGHGAFLYEFRSLEAPLRRFLSA